VVADLAAPALEVPWQKLHDAAQGPRSIVGRRRAAHHLGAAHQIRVDERSRHTCPPLADDPHPVHQRQDALAGDAAHRIDLEQASLPVLRDTGRLDDQGREGRGLDREFVRLDNGSRYADRRKTATAPIGRDHDLLIDFPLCGENDLERFAGDHLAAHGPEARVAHLERQRQFRIGDDELTVGVGKDNQGLATYLNTSMIDGDSRPRHHPPRYLRGSQCGDHETDPPEAENETRHEMLETTKEGYLKFGGEYVDGGRSGACGPRWAGTTVNVGV